MYVCVYVYRSVTLALVLLADFGPLRKLIEELWPKPLQNIKKWHLLI